MWVGRKRRCENWTVTSSHQRQGCQVTKMAKLHSVQIHRYLEETKFTKKIY